MSVLDKHVYAVFAMQREVGGPNEAFDPRTPIDLAHEATDAGK